MGISSKYYHLCFPQAVDFNLYAYFALSEKREFTVNFEVLSLLQITYLTHKHNFI